MSKIIEAYIADIKKYPMLSAEDEEKLFREYKETKSPHIVNKIVHGNLRLVFAIAKKYSHLGIEFSDLLQAGNRGLIEAVDKYDLDKGAKFSTYAGWWIRQKITREISNHSRTIRQPANKINLALKIHKYQEKTLNELGYEATPEEIAEVFDISQSEAVKLLYKTNALELDEPLYTSEGEEYTLGDNVDAGENTEEDATQKERQRIIETAMSKHLTPIEKHILGVWLGLRSLDPESKKKAFIELAFHYGKTRAWAHIQKDNALEKLKKDETLRELFNDWIDNDGV